MSRGFESGIRPTKCNRDSRRAPGGFTLDRMHLLDAMAREGFEEVIALNDRESGLRGYIAIHDTTGGPAFGGVRRFEYRSEAEAVMDCLRLARAMSHKCRLAELPAGGGQGGPLGGAGRGLGGGLWGLGPGG